MSNTKSKIQILLKNLASFISKWFAVFAVFVVLMLISKEIEIKSSQLIILIIVSGGVATFYYFNSDDEKEESETIEYDIEYLEYLIQAGKFQMAKQYLEFYLNADEAIMRMEERKEQKKLFEEAMKRINDK